MLNLKTCPACNSCNISLAYRSISTRGDDGKLWRVDECANCTHRFTNPQPSWKDVELYYKIYAKSVPARDDLSREASDLVQAQQTGLLRHIPIPTGKRLLDVGCNTGTFLRLAKALGAIIKGIEPRLDAAESGRANGLDIYCGTLEKFAETSNETFDVITANQVIEHVPDPAETLSIMRKMLAPEGMIWISVPNAAYPIARSIKGYWHSTDLPLHLMQFTPRSLAACGERAGLNVRAQKTESMDLAVAVSIRQYLQHKWKVPWRISSRIGLIDSYARKLASRLDQQCNGESILMEFNSG
jgi:2-polyprenyl-3-methyl-5-hydroxy-6-metoxy-1,4-benzoquinol methylase